MRRLLHIAQHEVSPRIWIEPFYKELRAIGQITVVENGEELSNDERAELIRKCNILITGWGAAPVPVSIARDRGSLEYICNVTGSMRGMIPLDIIDAGIPVTYWGDAPGVRIAEGAFTLLLAVVKDLHRRIQHIRSGGWALRPDILSGTLEGLNVGIYGCGAIGRAFIEMLRPFKPVIRVFDPYASEFPEDCIVVDSLDELFANSEAIAIHAGLSDETRGSVTAKLLAKLPQNGIVINTARGGIIDQKAIFAELESGRLRAGLDVLEPPYELPPDHPARKWENLILSAHNIGAAQPMDGVKGKELTAMHHICLDNIRRRLNGEPLRFTMDHDRYLSST